MTKYSNKYDSPLEILYTQYSIKLAQYLNKCKLKPNDITTLGVIFNFFALLSLFNKDFMLFFTFLILGHFCDALDGIYARLYNMESEIGYYYDHIADGLKILSLAYAFYILYYPKIDDVNMVIIYLIFLLCTIHFSIKSRLYSLEGEKVDLTLQPWIKIGAIFGKKEKLQKMAQYTKYFDESMSLIYITLVMSIIHYRIYFK